MTAGLNANMPQIQQIMTNYFWAATNKKSYSKSRRKNKNRSQ
ncbi:hypothetical protein SynSYN20_01000 [Synechococcus sp. SYN20]|nr:hypothetical protein SynSYN20_01000 [Synechococcus sp. SYN20]